MSHPSETTAGAAIGGLLGFAKAFSIISVVSWSTVLDTAILSAVGALVGFSVTFVLKRILRKPTGK